MNLICRLHTPSRLQRTAAQSSPWTATNMRLVTFKVCALRRPIRPVSGKYLRRRNDKGAEAYRQRDGLCAHGLIERDSPVVAGPHVVDHKLVAALVACFLSQLLDHRTSIAARPLPGINLDLLQHEATARLEPAMRTPYPAAIKPRLDDVVPPLLALFEAPVCFPLERACFQCFSTCLLWPNTCVMPDRLAARATGAKGSETVARVPFQADPRDHRR